MSNVRVMWLMSLMIVGLCFACGDDETATGGDGGASEALPAKLDTGTELSWNPKITISSATEFDYVNSKSDTAFTASITKGTYTYELKNGVGMLTIDGESADDGKLLSELPATIVLMKLTAAGVKVKIGDETFSGSLTLPLSSGGSGTGGGDDVEGKLPDGAEAATVNAHLVGSHELQFGAAQPGSPFKAGDMETFVVGADSTLTVMGSKISNPYIRNGNAAEILWNDGKYAWALTNNTDGTFNEIDVEDAATDKWLGQWADASKFMGGDTGGSDVGKDVKMSVSSSGGSGGVTGPWDIGTEVTINWDGAEGLALTYMNATKHPKYFGEDSKTDTMRVLKWTDGNEIDALTYLLTIDADDKLVKIKGDRVLSQNGQHLSGSSEAVP